MLSTAPEKILFIRLKAIGDVVLCTPLIRALRAAYPKAQIDFLADPIPAQLLQNNPRLTRVLTAPAKGVSLFAQWEFIKQLRQTRYDLVFDLFGNPRSAWIALLSGAPTRAGYAYRGRKWAYTHPVPMNRIRKYQVEVNLDVIRHLGIPGAGIDTEIFLTDGERKAAKNLLRTIGLGDAKKTKIGFNPTGTWSAKRWPAVLWRELILKTWRQLEVKPLLLTGPGDESLLAEIIQGLEDKVIPAPATGLRQLAGIISSLDLLVGNDGAPQHMAQALGVKSLTLFGPTWGISWNKPGDPRHRFLQDAPECGPCDKTICPNPREPLSGANGYQECLTRINPSKVLNQIKELLIAQKT